MIVEKNFLSKLKDFGLNSYESKIWTALLSRGVSTAGELSDIANVPRSRSYDVLESLEKKGFVIMKLGKPIKYLAVPPAEVIERVKKRINLEAESQQKLMEELSVSEVLSELNLLHTQGVNLVEPTEISGSIRGRENIYNHLESCIKNAKESVHIITSTQGLVRKSTALFKSLKKAKDRGVSIKIAAPITKEAQAYMEKLKEIAEVKDVKNVNARFCVIDGKEVTFLLTNDTEVHPSYDVAVWVNTPYFAEAMLKAFSF
jgi:HTH-type transcriptional regulator, sugar sensing transcriptional regulator